MSCKTPFVLKSDEVCLACETDVTAGELKANDAYDLYLISRGKPIREYVLVCFMNLQFFFSDKGGVWTEFEKQLFISRWKQTVLSVWNRKRLKVLSGGVPIILEFKFQTKIAGWWSYDHWEIKAVKTKNFATSYVNSFSGNSRLDDGDFKLEQKAHIGNQKFYQRGIVHEFGHMLGLKDEYKGGHWVGDLGSIMNSGEQVMGRHLKFLASWVDKKNIQHGIK